MYPSCQVVKLDHRPAIIKSSFYYPDMRHCALCQKTSLMAGTRKLLRGHYNPTNWSRKYPNLQKAKLPSRKRGLVCTQCLKGLSKQKPVLESPISLASRDLAKPDNS